ncbi:cannabinoid receptor 2-like isoform X1 [Myxocyprinus asiaticus]|uniref:cannabinoid receptor 2-like isoform X1 n=1 Tax=Myxocyprinus asiaticus TaxID=70543 RepID=UPI002221AE5B|nr:cannabinoid receptor 2-like isoform X1 [Myxocyprinus asiaticus]XP_051575610.1 cannabinoid receptor 2-like isoform X1 [Myxocyprinus asiaticus]
MENQTEHDPEATTVLYLNESRQNVSTAGESLCNSLKCYMVLTQQEKKAIGSICFLAGPVTFLENILVLGVIASSATLRSRPSYLFISSLALADTFASCFFTISFLDFHLYSNNDSPNTYLFKLGGVTMAFTGSVGSLLLTALDRYLCIYQASNYKVLLTRTRAKLAIILLWCITIFISFLPLMGWRCTTWLDRPCSRLFPYVDHHYQVCWSGLQLVVLSLIILAYALILWKAHRHEAVMGGPQLGRLSLRGQARMRMDIQLARTFSLILLILAVCWLPVLSFMIIDVSVILTNEQQRMFAFCSTLCLVNSCVNPLLYALRCRELRGELLTLLGCFKALRECNLGNTNVIQQDKNGCEFTRNNKDHTLSESNQETISESIDM